MNKTNAYLLTIVALCTCVVIGFKYDQFFLHKDYTFRTEVNCDPATEKCFRTVCDGECEKSAQIFSDGSPYKYVEMPASHAPACLEEETCLDFTCPTGDTTCTTKYCTDDALGEGEACATTTANE